MGLYKKPPNSVAGSERLCFRLEMIYTSEEKIFYHDSKASIIFHGMDRHVMIIPLSIAQWRSVKLSPSNGENNINVTIWSKNIDAAHVSLHYSSRWFSTSWCRTVLKHEPWTGSSMHQMSYQRVIGRTGEIKGCHQIRRFRAAHDIKLDSFGNIVVNMATPGRRRQGERDRDEGGGGYARLLNENETMKTRICCRRGTRWEVYTLREDHRSSTGQPEVARPLSHIISLFNGAEV